MKQRLLFIVFYFAFLISSCFAQQTHIDSLLTLLKNDKEDTSKVNHLNALGWALMYQNPDTAIVLSNQALDIITPLHSTEFTSPKGTAEGTEIKSLQAKTLGNLGAYYSLKADYPHALDYYLKALKIDKELKNKKGIAGYLANIGIIYSDQSNYSKALDYYFEVLKMAEELEDKTRIEIQFGNIGLVYSRQANYPIALDYYFKALKIAEGLGDKGGMARHLCNIGTIHLCQGDYPKALEYYFKALKIAEEQGNKNLIATDFGNIGNVYYEQKNYPQALDYYFMALKIAKELRDKNGIARNLGNIGVAYDDQKDYSQALNYYFRALKMAKELRHKNGIAIDFANIGALYTKTGKFKEAEQYLKKAIAIDDSINALDYLSQSEESLSQLYDTTKQYQRALIHYKKAMLLKDTLFSQENKKQLVRKEMNFEFDKKEAATKASHDKELAVAEAEKKKQQYILTLVSCVLILVFLFAGFIFRSLRITRAQKNTIELQKNEMSEQKELVEKQKEKIVDSITYAQRIQQSILMEESEIQNYLPESFIYFQPKDIVSGDFYWFSKVEGRSEIGEQRLENDSQLPTPDSKLIIAAVDCTGHGVPGAFMSMIGNTLLNQIVNEKHITTPSEILKHLNIGVYEALHQKKDGALSDDGMDIALCSIDYKNKELQYAGAQNPLYIVSNGEIEIIKANIHGIGGRGVLSKKTDPLKKEFTNHVIPIKKDMSIYLFTDGYADQFGGLERKKFGTQKFKELLLSNQQLDMKNQKELLASAHTEWKGNTIQIDDILVIGIKLK